MDALVRFCPLASSSADRGSKAEATRLEVERGATSGFDWSVTDQSNWGLGFVFNKSYRPGRMENRVIGRSENRKVPQPCAFAQSFRDDDGLG